MIVPCNKEITYTKFTKSRVSLRLHKRLGRFAVELHCGLSSIDETQFPAQPLNSPNSFPGSWRGLQERVLIGTLRSENGDGRENVAEKVAFFQPSSRLLIFSNVGESSKS